MFSIFIDDLLSVPNPYQNSRFFICFHSNFPTDSWRLAYPKYKVCSKFWWIDNSY